MGVEVGDIVEDGLDDHEDIMEQVVEADDFMEAEELFKKPKSRMAAEHRVAIASNHELSIFTLYILLILSQGELHDFSSTFH